VKVTIDISPTKTGHSVRGIGSYTKYLVEELKKREFKNIEFKFFESPTSPPPVDVIHYPYFDLFFHTLPIKKKTSRVVTIHDVIPLVFPKHFPSGIKGNINLLLQKQALKNVDAIICDSNTSKKDIIEILAIPEDKIHVIYLAPSSKFKPISDSNLLSHIAEKYKLPQKFVLYVGDVNWSKNIPNLLRAISKLNINLVMVGKALVNKSLIEVQEINKIIDELNIKNKIIKTGFVENEELVAIYNLASVTVLPSYYEGFGLPALESMACGTPIICSSTSSLLEIAKEIGIFFDPRTPDNIATAIKKLLSMTSEEEQQLRERSLRHAAQFSWSKVAKETVDVYKMTFESNKL